MLNEIVGQVTSKLGINEDQAKGGIGLIFNSLKDGLDAGDFEKLSGLIPGVSDAMSSASSLTSGSKSGIGGLISGALSAFGGNKLAGVAAIATGFKSLGLDASNIGQFGSVISSFLEEKGAGDATDLISKILH